MERRKNCRTTSLFSVDSKVVITDELRCMMICLPEGPTKRMGIVFVLMIGMETFTSSAFIFSEQLRRHEPACRSRINRICKGRMKVLHVATDIIDASVDTSAESRETEYLIGEGEENDDDAKNVLTFQSSFEKKSEPVARLPPNTNLDEFLLDTNHLLTAGKSVHSKIVPKSSELLEDWRIACDRVGACSPNLDHSVIMSVRTAGISIPGLTLEWSALIGTNLVYKEEHPELEFVLIKDYNTVSSGSRSIVWLFNKLTRNKSNSNRKKSKQGSRNSDTKLFTRLCFRKQTPSSRTSNSQYFGNDRNESFVIQCSGTMEMKFRIPSMLGRFMFSSGAGAKKAKAERKISQLITRQIEKDADQNLLRWEENFQVWTDSHSQGSINT